RIITNTFINRYRRRGRERSVLDTAGGSAIGEGVMGRATMSAFLSPGGTMDRNLLAEEIDTALSELPDDYRIMILLADVEELSYREIADVVGCPIVTVMSRLYRARRILQKRLVSQAVAMGIVDSD